MKKLLITGFEPFGGESINPSWEAVSGLPQEINGFRLTKLLIPVVFGEAAEKVIEVAEEIRPEAIICVGQAGGRSEITPELVGINLRYASIPDNKGFEPKDESILTGGDDACFSTLPVRRMAEAVSAAGIPSRVSYSAGTFVCNDVLYTLLSYFKNSETAVCFIHIPYCVRQNKSPSMELHRITDGLIAAIGCLE